MRHSGAIKFPCIRLGTGEKLKCTTNYKFLKSSERRKRIPGFAFANEGAESKTPGCGFKRFPFADYNSHHFCRTALREFKKNVPIEEALYTIRDNCIGQEKLLGKLITK